MNTFPLVLSIIGSASFGAIAGKLIDAFVTTKISYKSDKEHWLREKRYEAFTELSEEMLSLGLKRGTFSDIWKFRSLGARAYLLLEEVQLKKEIDEFIDNLYKINNNLKGTIVSNLPEDFQINLPNGQKAHKKDLETGLALSVLEDEAKKIVDKLGRALKK